jgi:phage repressor protein C with HTH and peptisase S24 domain
MAQSIMTTKIDISRVIKELAMRLNIEESDIAEKMGYDTSYLSRIKNGKSALNTKFIAKLKLHYPMVNPVYLDEGTTPMFLADPKTDQLVKEQQAAYIKTSKTLNIYDFDVQAGSMTLYDDASKEPSGTISFLGSEQCDFAVKVHGESMNGKIANGGIIAVKEIQDKEVIPFGHIFLIITQDLRMVKYIKKSTKGEDFIRLSSHNSTQYEDFDIHRDKVLKLFIVKKILNDES